MKCNHDEAEQDVALVDGMCPLCLAAEIAEMKKDLAKCFMELYDFSFSFADDLATKYFDTWQEIREAANRQ